MRSFIKTNNVKPYMHAKLNRNKGDYHIHFMGDRGKYEPLHGDLMRMS